MTFPVRRALISCFDKTGVVEFATALHDLGIDIVSSGGTAQAIADAGIPVTTVEDVTGMPEMLDHRVVTLHPKIHGGILADLGKENHHKDMETFGIEPFGLVVVNLYPFFEKPSIETIDIGGPAMVRAAAKNNAFVGVVTRPHQYEDVLSELKNNNNALTDEFRWKLAREAYALTASFDAAIVDWMSDTAQGRLPDEMIVSLKKRSDLRYGENPHQNAAIFDDVNQPASWPQLMTVHQGKELSYINYLDLQSSWSLVHQFNEIACVIVKHANPCGVALGETSLDAYTRAFDCDDISAFGGVVAINREIDAPTAEAIGDAFTEVVIAPSVSEEAFEIFSKKKNLRVITAPAPNDLGGDVKHIDGAYLVQRADDFTDNESAWKVVTDRQPTDTELAEARFAWSVCAGTSSNAIVLTNDRQAMVLVQGSSLVCIQHRLLHRKQGIEQKVERVLQMHSFHSAMELMLQLRQA